MNDEHGVSYWRMHGMVTDVVNPPFPISKAGRKRAQPQIVPNRGSIYFSLFFDGIFLFERVETSSFPIL
jgi:hypothetical protein